MLDSSSDYLFAMYDKFRHFKPFAKPMSYSNVVTACESIREYPLPLVLKLNTQLGIQVCLDLQLCHWLP